jgi:2-(1,2-epoxy-1,2-dihydrophenyl)acetyl-CoA isomerase
MTGPVAFALDNGIATLTLDRPERGNTIDQPMARALLEAALRCDEDAAIRCVVVTGRGKLFCGGGDVGSFAAAGDSIGLFLSELAGTLHMALSRFLRMRKPLVTLVNGPAAGAGLSLAIAGDVALAGRSAHFTAAYGALGLSPDGGMSWRLPRLIGMRRAQEIILTNRRVTSEEAAAIGLVSRVVEDDELALAGAKIAAELAAAPTEALGAARSLLLDSFDTTLEAQLERETRSIAALGRSAETRSRVAAFLARRNSKPGKDPGSESAASHRD